jgi:hypothetical protein
MILLGDGKKVLVEDRNTSYKGPSIGLGNWDIGNSAEEILLYSLQ